MASLALNASEDEGENFSKILVHFTMVRLMLFICRKYLSKEIWSSLKIKLLNANTWWDKWNSINQGFGGNFLARESRFQAATDFPRYFMEQCKLHKNCAIFLFILLFLGTELVIVRSIHSKNHTANLTVLFGISYISEASCSALWHS